MVRRGRTLGKNTIKSDFSSHQADVLVLMLSHRMRKQKTIYFSGSSNNVFMMAAYSWNHVLKHYQINDTNLSYLETKHN